MRRVAFAVPFLAVPLAAAACGGGRHDAASTGPLSDDPLTAVTSAARKTVQAGTEHAKLAGRIVASGQAITFTGSGDFDQKARLGSMHVDLAVGGLNTSVDEVTQGTVVYVKSDLTGMVLPAGKTWLKIDVEKTAAAQSATILSLLSQDPTHALTALARVKGVTKVGAATVDGVTATRYRGRIDLSKLSGTATAGAGRYDVWIGEDGYVHRVKANVRNGAATSTVTADLSAFGDPVKVSVPPASQTFDGSNSTIPGLGG